MARMIPPTVHLGTVSAGEHSVFERLRDDPTCAGWTVLHSYDLPRHVTRKMGEIDFVVLIPGRGILCLSVKHHLDVSRSSEGVWILGQEPPSSQGPFKKARDDMFSLKARIAEVLPARSFVTFGFAVLFTRARPQSPIPPVEWQEHEAIYADVYRVRPIGSILEESMISTNRHLEVRSPIPFGESEIADVVGLLRPELEVFVPPKERAAQTENELKHFTDEQMLALDDADYNRRMLFTGPAGTGKTLLAIELYRREVDAGKKCLFLCYNKLLKQFVESKIGNTGEGCSTADSFLLNLAGIDPPEDPSNAFWKDVLPELAIQATLRDDWQPWLDSVVVDEAQDLIEPRYLDALDQCIKGGLKEGRWVMFGDFERQSIYSGVIDCSSFASSNQASVRTLRVNCRNTRLIAKYAEILGGMRPGYGAVRRSGDGAKPDMHFYRSPEQQKDFLEQSLKSLKERFDWSDIVVLSPKRDEAACASKLDQSRWRSRMRPYELAASGLRFSTIQRFKGLEAGAIIVTDIETLGAYERASLLYIATTRAIDRLVVLAHIDVRTEIRDALMR